MLEQITSTPPADMVALLWAVVVGLSLAVVQLWRLNGQKNKQNGDLHSEMNRRISCLYRQLVETQTAWREAERRHAQEMFEAAKAAEMTGNAFRAAIEALKKKPGGPC